jgi:hypothetical protein
MNRIKINTRNKTRLFLLDSAYCLSSWLMKYECINSYLSVSFKSEMSAACVLGESTQTNTRKEWTKQRQGEGSSLRDATAHNYSASQKTSRPLSNSKVHYCIHNSLWVTSACGEALSDTHRFPNCRTTPCLQSATVFFFSILSNSSVIQNNWLGRMRKGVVMAYSEVLPQHLHGRVQKGPRNTPVTTTSKPQATVLVNLLSKYFKIWCSLEQL